MGMVEECFVCVDDADKQYDVLTDGSRIVEAGTLCGSCVADFRDTDWIELNGPVETGSEADD